jgi:3-methyladenine DNA glycosylase AlkD
MINPFHAEILQLIKEQSGTPTKHTFSDSYLGNTHIRYPINAPALRAIIKEWMRSHRNLSANELAAIVTSLIEGVSSTEKITAGIMLGYATPVQRKFNPAVFDEWLNQVIGWAEVDALCTGDYTITEIPANWSAWKKLLTGFSKNTNINKRRAGLVLLCSPVSRVQDERLSEMAFQIIDRLKSEKAILITKAISWLLRSMVKHYKADVATYLKNNADTLPKIAVRETMVKLKTGKKNKAAKS